MGEGEGRGSRVAELGEVLIIRRANQYAGRNRTCAVWLAARLVRCCHNNTRAADSTADIEALLTHREPEAQDGGVQRLRFC